MLNRLASFSTAQLKNINLEKDQLLAQGAMLGFSCALAAFFLLSLNRFTAPIIQANDAERTLSMMSEVIPDASIDPQLLDSEVSFEYDGMHYQLIELGDDKSRIQYQIYTSELPGYSGNIRFIVGVTFDGVITNVRVISHTETPGLGDKIELAKSDWVTNFNQRSLANTAIWKVKKDGGEFEQFSGATITPRAVVKGVHNTLKAQHFFNQNKEDALHE
ncbi:RnfABCDGE type electron transport complex subunit G [Vibrio sp. FNV 38]|nr:RnfABCDGE type electron transport complex subunit G [Vibrio sp. FNV 38]